MRLESSGPEHFDPKGYKTELDVRSREGTPVAEITVATWVEHLDDLGGPATVPQWRRSPVV